MTHLSSLTLTALRKNGQKKVKDQVFISYSHRDDKWRQQLEKHLKPFLRNGAIKSWSDQHIEPGSQWFEEIQSGLTNSKIAVLLVSPDFLNSDFIHEHELGPLLKAAEHGGVNILWIPIYSSAYKQTPLKNYQAIIDPGKPLAAMPKAKREQVWVKICEDIQKAVNRPNESRESPETSTLQLPPFLDDQPRRSFVREPYSPIISRDRSAELARLAKTSFAAGDR